MDDTKTLVPLEGQPAPSAPVEVRRGIGIGTIKATRASSDRQLLDSWVKSMRSPHSRRACEVTGGRFVDILAKAGVGLRTAMVEDVRDALKVLVADVTESSGHQYILRCKALMSFAHKLGYSPFNAGVTIKADPLVLNLAQRIVGPAAINSLIGEAIKERDFLLVSVGYAGGLRVAELVGLTCGAVIVREVNGARRAQLHVIGKGRRERDVLLPPDLSARLFEFIKGKLPSAFVFCSSKRSRSSEPLTTRGANHLIKRLAAAASVTGSISPHWLRHAHASHALDNGAALHEVQTTLGHANISTTSAYLHARPGTSSADKLDASIWRDRRRNGQSSL